MQAMEARSSQDISRRVDLWTLTESDPDSIQRMTTIANSLYGAGTFDYRISSIDGGGDSTAFLYDTTTVSLLESIEVPGNLTHSILRGKFRPQGSLGESDFYVYATHLKSGATSTDTITRGAEMDILRRDADLLGATAEIIFAGDFNLHGTQEAAWSVLTSSGPASAVDPANAIGNWTSNLAFKALHTHAATALRSRFDVQFLSDELFDQSGLEYIAGSYRVFGNDGSHLMGSSLTTGTAAAPSVLAALAAASDHLPIVSDFEFVASAPVIVSQTGGVTQVIEGEQSDTYQLRLGFAPTAEVSLTLRPPQMLDVGAGAGIPRVIQFTPSNYQTPISITVSAPDDARFERTQDVEITHQAASEDLRFHGVAIPTITVNLKDNDLPGIVINEIDSDTPGADAAEFVEIYDGGIGHFDLTGLSLILINGNGDVPYASFDLDGRVTNAEGFFVLGNSAVTGIDWTFPNGTLQNGADAVALIRGNPSDFSLVLTVGLVDAIVYGSGDPTDSGLIGLMFPGQLQLNENGTGQGTTQSLARMADGGEGRKTTGFRNQPPTPGTWNASPSLYAGDFDADGDLDLADIDALVSRVANDNFSIPFDLVADGILGSADIDAWLGLAGSRNLGPQRMYRRGDANLDGGVDGSDFGIWNANKFSAHAAWSKGDFNADGFVDGSDFGIWNAAKFTSSDHSRMNQAEVRRHRIRDAFFSLRGSL